MIITEPVPEKQLNCRLTCLDAIVGNHTYPGPMEGQ